MCAHRARTQFDSCRRRGSGPSFPSYPTAERCEITREVEFRAWFVPATGAGGLIQLTALVSAPESSSIFTKSVWPCKSHTRVSVSVTRPGKCLVAVRRRWETVAPVLLPPSEQCTVCCCCECWGQPAVARAVSRAHCTFSLGGLSSRTFAAMRARPMETYPKCDAACRGVSPSWRTHG